MSISGTDVLLRGPGDDVLPGGGRAMPTKVHAIDIHVGHRLRERRLEAMLGLAAVGQVVGVRAQQIQKYENGKDRIASSRLFLLAAALGVPVSFFFVGLPKAARSKASSTTLMQRKRNGRH
jgi:transcriptional regulator with XRE-family HTH domain